MKATEKSKQYMKLYYQSHKDSIKLKSKLRQAQLKLENPYHQVCRKFNLSKQDILDQLNSQFGACLICSESESIKDQYGNLRKLCVDHDHKTGESRAILCARCNSALGLLKEDERIVTNLLNYINVCKAS